MIEKIITLILCHLFGDYVLQSDYLANNKGKDLYLLLVHSSLYCIPFIFAFGMRAMFLFVFVSHIIIDMMKARYNLINIAADQALHYAILVWLCLAI